MISWFNRSRIRAYVKLSTRKQNKMKQEIDVRFAEQRSIMDFVTKAAPDGKEADDKKVEDADSIMEESKEATD